MYAEAHCVRVVTVQECGPSPNFPVEWPWADPVNFRHHIPIARRLLLSTTTTANDGDGSVRSGLFARTLQATPEALPLKGPYPAGHLSVCTVGLYWDRAFNNR